MKVFKQHLVDIKPGMAVALGIPLDENSSFLRGAAAAPQQIRDILHAGSANLSAENGLDLETNTFWKDIGDIIFPPEEDALSIIKDTIGDILKHGAKTLSLGGDHSITYPIIQAFAEQYPRLSILHIDAHADLYHEFGGSKYSHACPFARIMESRLVHRLVQVGIRTMNPHQRQQAERFGVEVIEMRHWSQAMTFEFEEPLYISLDIDAFDPAFAPGVSHHEPGGFSTRDVLRIIQTLRADVVGADIVEYNPTRDPIGITGMLAAKFYKELLALLIV